MKIKNIFQSNYTDANWRKPLPIIASPVATEEDRLEEKHNDDHGQAEAGQTPASSENPVLKKNRQPTSMELLFDLFFVSALAAFNASHELTTADSISNVITGFKSYISFITVLWFYWLQATIFDVRFYTDSLVGRAFKLIHFGLTAGFAITAVRFDVNKLGDDSTQFRSVCILLTASRVVLIAQYIPVAWYLRRYKSTFMAKLIVIATLSVSAIIFLGLGLGAKNIHSTRTHAVCFWEILSFKGTPIIDRFIGLTLIVLGEGIVGMTDSLKSIAMGTKDISGTSLGLILSHILLICFVYALYIDQIDGERFEYIQQQFWVLFHYPLHMAILVTSKGSRSWILYDVSIHVLEGAKNAALSGRGVAKTSAEVVDVLKKVVEGLSNRLVNDDGRPDFASLYDDLLSIKDLSKSRDELRALTNQFYSRVTIWIFHTFSIQVKDEAQSKEKAEGDNAASAEVTRILAASTIVFRFFFIAAGITLVVLALQHWLSKSNKSRAEFLSIIITTTAGVFLSLLSVMSLYDSPNKESALGHYINISFPYPMTLSKDLNVANNL
ncbi:uncharacterized protein GIQ15_05784 [Arthroderma uncinatum]|uniref:uncharacterized protein n=1 Tax=Arthroderma uncinatum TaxID=74035 RepID=UPI00144AA30D|nr:uncharacterized protein GIQ15_05784 [Arthroderma uncinatum]KAF3480437.1 hypothetical protein GIQ15_05784 [Arthroderma uncinatum]